MKQNELQHHGVPGMKWGVRRYQNKDGSLTPAGRKKAAKMKEEYTALTGKKLIRKAAPKNNKTPEKTKNIKDMSDDEIRAKINRIQLERTLSSLEPKQVSRGKVFINKFMSDIVAPAATDIAKQLVKSYMVKNVNKALQLDNEHKVYTNNKKKN